jgi:AcrR family transcriptional regulator
MARSATLSGERRRTEILDAALRCFDRQGVTATTIEDIRAESGASIGSIYHQFASKDEILTHLYCQAVSSFGAGLTKALRSKRHPKQGLRAAVQFHVRWIDVHRPLARIMLRWDESELSVAGQAKLREESRRFAKELGLWFKEAAVSGDIRSMTPELYAALLMGPLLEYGRRMIHDATIGDHGQPELADGIWRALATDRQ